MFFHDDIDAIGPLPPHIGLAHPRQFFKRVAQPLDIQREKRALHIALGERLGEETAEPRPGEDALGDHRAGRHDRGVEQDHRDERHRRVPERVAHDDAPRIGAAGTRGTHAVVGCIALPNDASVALHEKCGFVKVAHFPQVGRKFERWVDVGFWQANLF